MDALDLLKDAHKTRRGDRGIPFDVHRFAIEIVHDVEGPRAPATRQRIGDKVRGPYGVGQPWYIQRHSLALGQALPGVAP
jgi:hypothetical protein